MCPDYLRQFVLTGLHRGACDSIGQAELAVDHQQIQAGFGTRQRWRMTPCRDHASPGSVADSGVLASSIDADLWSWLLLATCSPSS